MLKQKRIYFARPVGFMSEHPDVGTYLAMTSMRMYGDPRVENIEYHWNNKARILDSRNTMAKQALEEGYDYLLMVDPDMRPDMYLPSHKVPFDQQPHKNPLAKPFWESSFNFMLENRCGIIGAPAVSAPPVHNLNVFLPGEAGAARRVTQEEAVKLHRENPCFQRVTAVGSGVMLIDVDVFRKLPKPWFDDHYNEATRTDVYLSQDINFCFKCTNLDIPIYCNWYSWAGHWKPTLYGEPPQLAGAPMGEEYEKQAAKMGGAAVSAPPNQSPRSREFTATQPQPVTRPAAQPQPSGNGHPTRIPVDLDSGAALEAATLKADALADEDLREVEEAKHSFNRVKSITVPGG